MRKSQPQAHDPLAANSQNPHLSGDQILLYLDGELSSRETAQAKAHFEACWSCRVRSEQIAEVIADVVTYRDTLIKSSVPLSTDARTSFLAQLRQLAQSVGKRSLASRILDFFRVLQGEIFPRQAWITGIVITSFALFLLVRFSGVPRVSASQFLANAQASELRARDGIAKPVVYQKLSIRLGDHAVARTIYRDVAGNHQVNYLDGGTPRLASDGLIRKAAYRPDLELAEFERVFREAHLSWEDPLSPASYDAWRHSLGRKQDRVTQVSDGQLTLMTTTAEGPISEATMTVRAKDFHPVAEIFYLSDAERVEVTELAWEVIPMEAIDSGIFATPYVPSRAPLRSALPTPMGPSDAELAETELRARIALHAEGADLGEQIEFQLNKSNSAARFLEIRGIVNSPERRSELSAALEGIPHVELRLDTVEDAALQKNLLADNKSGSSETHFAKFPEFTPDAASGKAALAEQLDAQFPNSEERLHFVNSAVELAQECLAQAWALRRLEDHYTPDEVALLSVGSRQTLELLIRDHVSALRQNVDALQDLVSPVLSGFPPTARSILSAQASSTTAVPAHDWRSSVREIFPGVQSMEIQIVALAGGPDMAVSDPEVGVPELRSALSELGKQLPVLYQQVNARFLDEQE
jgi:hypothetical protein